MMQSAVIKNWLETGYDLYLNETYLVYFSHNRQVQREVPGKRLNEHNAKMNMALRQRDIVSVKTLAGMNPLENPNVRELTGREILGICEQGYVPVFDGASPTLTRDRNILIQDFRTSRRLTLIPIAGIGAIRHLKDYLQNTGRIR